MHLGHSWYRGLLKKHAFSAGGVRLCLDTWDSMTLVGLDLGIRIWVMAKCVRFAARLLLSHYRREVRWFPAATNRTCRQFIVSLDVMWLHILLRLLHWSSDCPIGCLGCLTAARRVSMVDCGSGLRAFFHSNYNHYCIICHFDFYESCYGFGVY